MRETDREGERERARARASERASARNRERERERESACTRRRVEVCERDAELVLEGESLKSLFVIRWTGELHNLKLN